jgi:hypothetical protein
VSWRGQERGAKGKVVCSVRLKRNENRKKVLEGNIPEKRGNHGLWKFERAVGQ